MESCLRNERAPACRVSRRERLACRIACHGRVGAARNPRVFVGTDFPASLNDGPTAYAKRGSDIVPARTLGAHPAELQVVGQRPDQWLGHELPCGFAKSKVN